MPENGNGLKISLPKNGALKAWALGMALAGVMLGGGAGIIKSNDARMAVLEAEAKAVREQYQIELRAIREQEAINQVMIRESIDRLYREIERLRKDK